MARTLPWRCVWITGASTGIGREIALQLAAQGVTVAASARSRDKLDAMGPGIHAYPLDVTDRAAMHAAARRIAAELGPVDLAIFAAGTYKPVTAAAFAAADFDQAMATNYIGVVNGLAALLPVMLAAGRGHLAWIASVAGYSGLPKASAYGPSKAALINLAESLKPELERSGVGLSLVNPGFVETPLTAQNDFRMPFLMNPADAARLTIAGLAAGRFEIAYPLPFILIMKLARILPYWLYFPLALRFLLTP